MAERKPTEKAELEFAEAARRAQLAALLHSSRDQITVNNHLSSSMYHMAQGMSDLATGLRATYNLLDEVRTLLRNQKR